MEPVFPELLKNGKEVPVPPRLAVGTHPHRQFPKKCFQKAFKYVLAHDEPGMRLIHGVAIMPGTAHPFEHAWVELPGDIVFDGVVQRFFTRESYGRVMTILRPLLSLTRKQAMRRLRIERRYGPWFDLREHRREVHHLLGVDERDPRFAAFRRAARLMPRQQ